jgi:hypothetical protein
VGERVASVTTEIRPTGIRDLTICDAVEVDDRDGVSSRIAAAVHGVRLRIESSRRGREGGKVRGDARGACQEVDEAAAVREPDGVSARRVDVKVGLDGGEDVLDVGDLSSP